MTLTVDTSLACCPDSLPTRSTFGSSPGSSSSSASSPGRRARRRAAAVRAGRSRALRKSDQRRLREFGFPEPASLTSALRLLREGKVSGTTYHMRHAQPERDDTVLREIGSIVASSATGFALFLISHLPDAPVVKSTRRAPAGDGVVKNVMPDESESPSPSPSPKSLLECGRALHVFSPSSVAQMYVMYRDECPYVYETMLLLFDEYRRQLAWAAHVMRNAASNADDFLSARREHMRLLVMHPLSDWATAIGRASDDYCSLTPGEWLSLSPVDQHRMPQLLRGLLMSQCTDVELAYVLTSVMEMWLVNGLDSALLLCAAESFLPFSSLVASIVRGDLLDTGGRYEASIWSALRVNGDEESCVDSPRSVLSHLMLTNPATWRLALTLESGDQASLQKSDENAATSESLLLLQALQKLLPAADVDLVARAMQL